MSLKNGFIKKFGNNFSKNISLSNYSWFNLGGNAEFLFKPNDSFTFKKVCIDQRNKSQTNEIILIMRLIYLVQFISSN